MNQLDLLTIGDSSIDLYMKIGDDAAIAEAGEGGELPKFCFYHGSKIPVDSFETSVAGNAINIAAGATALGLKTAVYSELGDDSNTERIIEELKRRNIDTQFCIKNEGVPTDLHTVIVFRGERTIFSYHGKKKYIIRNWPTPKYVYYTSMSEGFQNFQMELIKYIEKNPKVGLAFNPGTIHMKTGIESLKNVIRITDILFVNREEASKLTGSYSETEILHKELAKLGPKLTVITDGSKGASAFDGNKVYFQTAYSDSRPILDKTGAGDAFSSGFISAIIYGKPLETALKWGVINSGCRIKVIGAINGLLTKKEIESIKI